MDRQHRFSARSTFFKGVGCVHSEVVGAYIYEDRLRMKLRHGHRGSRGAYSRHENLVPWSNPNSGQADLQGIRPRSHTDAAGRAAEARKLFLKSPANRTQDVFS